MLSNAQIRSCGSPSTFKFERAGHHGNRRNPSPPRQFGNDRGSPRAGPAPHAGRNEAKIDSVERRVDFTDGFLRCRAAKLRPGPRTKSFCRRAAELDSALDRQPLQRLGIGIGSDQVDVWRNAINQARHAVPTAPADSEHRHSRKFRTVYPTDEAHPFSPDSILVGDR